MFVTSIGVAQISPDLVWRADTTSANNYRVYITNFPGAYTSDVRFIKFKVTNTDTVTLRVGALPVAPMRKWNGSAWVALDSGDIKINTDYWFAYDSDSSWFRLHNEDLYGSGGLPSGASEDDILSYAGGAPVWSVPDWWNIEGDTQLIDTVKVTTDKMLEFTSIETTGQGTALILDSLGLKLINEWQGGASSGVIQSQSDGRLFVSDEGLDPWLEGGDFETDGDIRILLGTHGFKFQYDATPFAVPFFNISQDTLNGFINGPIELHGDTYNFTSGFGASFLQSYYNEVNFDIVYTFGATDVSVYPDGYKVFTGLQTSGAYTKLKNDSIKFDAPNIQLLEPLTNIDSTVHLLARRDSDGMLVSVDQSSIGGGGGITNGGASNELVKSDGTNVTGTGVYSVAPGILQNSTGDSYLVLSTDLAGISSNGNGIIQADDTVKITATHIQLSNPLTDALPTSHLMLRDSVSGDVNKLGIGTGLSIVDGDLVSSEAGVTRLSVNDTSHGYSVGTPLRMALGGTFELVPITNDLGVYYMAGVVVEVVDANNYVIDFGNYLTGLSGLTPGTMYYADGDDVPTTSITNFPVYQAISSTTAVVVNRATDQTWAVPTTSSTLSLHRPLVHFTRSSPGTGGFALNTSVLRLGLVQKIYHEDTVAPDLTIFGGGHTFHLIGGAYVPNELNIIYYEWVGGTDWEYWITQDQ